MVITTARPDRGTRCAFRGAVARVRVLATSGVLGTSVTPPPHDPLHPPLLDEVRPRDSPHLLRAHPTHARLELPELGETSEQERVDELSEHRAPTLLADRVHAEGVRLRLLELPGRDGFVAQLRELAQEPAAGDVLLLGRRRDVAHEGAGERALGRERVHRVPERLLVAQLVEEAPAQST